MKGVRILCTALMVLFLFVGAAYGETTPIPAQVQSAAAQGLELFKSKVGPQATRYGFADSDEVSRVTLGEGFQVHYVDADKLRNAAADSLLALATPQKVWEFTINLDGQPKSFLTVGFEDGQYRVVHFGGNAADFGTALANFGQFTSAKGASVQPTLVKAGPAYYFVGRIADDEFALPAVSSAKATSLAGMDYSKLWPAAEVVQYLRQVQQSSVPGQRGGLVPGAPDRTATSSPNQALTLTLGFCLSGIVGAATIWYRHLHHR